MLYTTFKKEDSKMGITLTVLSREPETIKFLCNPTVEISDEWHFDFLNCSFPLDALQTRRDPALKHDRINLTLQFCQIKGITYVSPATTIPSLATNCLTSPLVLTKFNKGLQPWDLLDSLNPESNVAGGALA